MATHRERIYFWVGSKFKDDTHILSDVEIIDQNCSTFFDKLPDMRKYTQAQRITKLRQQSDACVKLGSETASNTKYVLAYLVELQN